MKDLEINCIPIYNCSIVTKGSLNIADGNEMNYGPGKGGVDGKGQDARQMQMVFPCQSCIPASPLQ